MAVAAVLPGSHGTGRVPAAALVRPLLVGLTIALLLGLGVAVVERVAPREVPVVHGVVGVGPDGRVADLPAGALVPGTRVVEGPGSAAAVDAERAWLAAGTVPVVPELADSYVVRSALLDLRVLTVTDGVPVAA